MRSILGLILCLLLVVGCQSCSLPPGTRYYSVTQRTILAPIVIHGTVLNISSPTRRNALYDVCVNVIQVIKGKKNLPKVVCFGKFGGEHLCLTNVYNGANYIFFINDMFTKLTARYDGFPQAAVPASPRALDMAKRGFCNPHAAPPSSCVLPTIRPGGLNSIKRVKEGDSLIIPCAVRSGTQPIVVRWHKRGSHIMSPTFGTSLHLSQVTTSDMGTYVCTILNPAGQVSELTRVVIVLERCGTVIALKSNQNVTIKSPKYPQTYPGDKMCSWRICPSAGQRIGLDFKHFNLLRRDSVQIYHECDPDGGGKQKYCSNTSPGKIISHCTSCIQFLFVSTFKRNHKATGFVAEVSSTNKGSSIFDFGKLYCDNPILFRFIPETVYASEVKGKVLFNYKQAGPSKGQKITILIRFTSSVDIFGCYDTMKENLEYYVGASRTSSGDYVMRFFMLTDSRKKPPMFDKYFDGYKVTPPACYTTPSL